MAHEAKTTTTSTTKEWKNEKKNDYFSLKFSVPYKVNIQYKCARDVKRFHFVFLFTLDEICRNSTKKNRLILDFTKNHFGRLMVHIDLIANSREIQIVHIVQCLLLLLLLMMMELNSTNERFKSSRQNVPYTHRH